MRLIGRQLAVTTSLFALATLAGASPAFAQNAAAPADEQTAAEDDATPTNEIVVTGSLIQRPNNTAVSPIVTISDAAIKESGTANLQDALNQLPGFTVGGNTSTGGQGTGAPSWSSARRRPRSAIRATSVPMRGPVPMRRKSGPCALPRVYPQALSARTSSRPPRSARSSRATST